VTLTLSSATGNHHLQDRLAAVAPLIFGSEHTSPGQLGTAELLTQLVDSVLSDLRTDRLWLLFVTIAARYPTQDELADGVREFELSDNDRATLWLLDTAVEGADDGSAPRRMMTFVQDAVLVEVDHSAKHNLHTGIQQVVRELLPRWTRDHQVIPVAWTPESGSHRALTETELARVLKWGDIGDEQTTDYAETSPIIVPWRCIVVLAEVPLGNAPLRLAPLAHSSGNSLVAIGYDCIPIVSSDLVPTPDSSRFVNYLSVIKHARRVAGISASATTEFQGFVETLPTQGLLGPVVVECMLPTSPRRSGPSNDVATLDRPMVLMVGSFEPRKNHLAVLHAAETLWRAGLDFDLTFIGGSGWGSELPDRIDELTHAGRPITVLRNVDQSVLDRAYRSATFTVFPSTHEGFGLPVAESLAAETPVITSDFGSMRELAAAGGALTIDPHDDAALVTAMRTLLTDAGELERLRLQIADRTLREWDDYAAELWAALITPLLSGDEQ